MGDDFLVIASIALAVAQLIALRRDARGKKEERTKVKVSVKVRVTVKALRARRSSKRKR